MTGREFVASDEARCRFTLTEEQRRFWEKSSSSSSSSSPASPGAENDFVAVFSLYSPAAVDAGGERAECEVGTGGLICFFVNILHLEPSLLELRLSTA